MILSETLKMITAIFLARVRRAIVCFLPLASKFQVGPDNSDALNGPQAERSPAS